MFKFLRSKKGQGMVEYGLIIAMVAIAAMIGLHSLGDNNANRTMEIAETLDEAGDTYEAESKDLENKESIKNYNSGNGGYYSGGGGGGLGSFPSYSGGVNWKPSVKEDGTTDENDRIGTIDKEATEDAPVLNDDAPEGNQAPIASFYVVNSKNLTVGETLTLYNTSTDPDGDAIVKEEWDGLPSGNKFTIEGSYPIKLRVVDEWGNWSQWATVTVEIKNKKPVAIITSSPNFSDGDEFDKTEYFTWSSSSSYDPDGHKIIEEEWDDKRNNYSAGEYTVRLRVKDEYGLWSEWAEKSFTIFDGSRPVIIGGTVSDAKEQNWTTDIISQTEADIPQILSPKNIYFKTVLNVIDEDRDDINAIQYRIDGNVQNTLYNVTSDGGNGETKTITSSTSSGVPQNNSLSFGQHSVEIRVRDTSGAWSNWTDTFYVEVINVKEEEPEEGDEVVEYITMEIYNFNKTSQSATGGNKGPWFAGDFVVIPEDKTGAELKDAAIEIDGTEIDSEFTTIAGQPVVIFNYTTEGVHTLRAKFLDENDVWSSYVENTNFTINKINITATLTTYNYCLGDNCSSYNYNFSTSNTGTNTDKTMAQNSIEYFDEYSLTYSNSAGAPLSYLNIKVNETITKVTPTIWNTSGSPNTTMYYYGDMYSSTGFPIISYTNSEPAVVSFQIVDINGNASDWTNTVTLMLPSANTENVLTDTTVTNLRVPTMTTIPGWTALFADYDDGGETVVLTDGKKINFGGTDYSSIYVNANGKISFGHTENCASQRLDSSCTNNSIVLITDNDLSSNAYYKHTTNGIDVMWAYDHLDNGYSASHYMMVSLNADGSGSAYFIDDQIDYTSSTPEILIKLSSSNYVQLNNPLTNNSVFSWTKSNDTPYYTLTSGGTIPSNISTAIVTENIPVYLNGTKISNTLRFDSDAMNDYAVYDIAGDITLVNTTTNTTFNSTFTSNYDEYCDYYDCYYYYTMNIAEIPGITPGEYTVTIDTPYINHSWSDSQLGAVLTNNTTPITITLTSQPTIISNITLSETKDYNQLSIYTNNNGSRKDQIELKINDVTYVQKTDESDSQETENSFFFEGTSNSTANIRIYNNSLVPGSTITVKARIHLESTDTWTEWFEKEITIPAMTISSVSVSSTPNQGLSTITTYLNNYANKTFTGVKIKVDDITVSEDTSLTSVSTNYFTKQIPLLSQGSHTLKVIALYKINGSDDTIYETVEKVTTYNQPSYTPSISSISYYTTNGTNYVYKINYSNTYSVPMYTEKYTVKINDVDISNQVTLYQNSTSYDYINIPMSLFTPGTNTIKVKTSYRPQNNMFLDLVDTNEASTTRTVSAPYVSGLSLDTSNTNNSYGQYTYFTVSYSNERKQNIDSLIMLINDETTNATITTTNSNKTSSTVRIEQLEAGTYTAKVIVTFADGTVSERTLSYTINTPLRYNTTLSHYNTTSNAQEYLQVLVYSPYAYTFTKDDVAVTFNGNNVPVASVSQSTYSSGSMSTSNGTMKYAYYVNVFLNDYIYREGTNTIGLTVNLFGTDIEYTREETNGTIGYPYANVTQTDNLTDPAKLTFQTYYYNSYYYRVESLKVQEFSDSNRTNLTNEYIVANTNSYKYVGSTLTKFEPVPITNPTETHYYKLSFITPWGTESSKINFTYTKKAPTLNSYKVSDYYTKDDTWNPYLYINVYEAALGISEMQIKYDNSDVIYTKTSFGTSTYSGYKKYSAQFTDVKNPQNITSNGVNTDGTTLKWRIKYSNGVYTDWVSYNTNFYYPYLSSISEIVNEDSIINGVPTLKLKISGSRLTSGEEFDPIITLDNEVLPVLNKQYISASSWYVWVEQPESGIYNNLSVKFGYNNRYTNTINKKDVVIYATEDALLMDVIPITRTENATMPSYTLSEYTYFDIYSNDFWAFEIDLTTPVNFLGTSFDRVVLSEGTLSFANTDWPTTVALGTDTTYIKNYISSLENHSVAFFPSVYSMWYDEENPESGIYYKETTNTINIIYKNMYIDAAFNVNDANTPYFDIFITVNKTDGSGTVYYGDMNKTNNSTANTTLTTNSTTKVPRTFVVKDSSTEYGYLKPWYTDASTINTDTMYSNASISWNAEYIQELPPIITDISYSKVSETKMDVTIKFTSRSETTTVSAVQILPNNLTWDSFDQTATDTVVIRNLDVPPTTATTMFATITVDNLISTMKPFVMLTAPEITSMEYTSDEETESIFTFTVNNETNSQILSATPIIKSRTTEEEIELNIKNTILTNNSITIITDLLPQDYYWLSLEGTYQDIGNVGIFDTFTTNFNTTTQDFTYSVNVGNGSKTYLMREVDFPEGLTTSTSGYTTLFSSSDDTYGTITLPTGNYINFAGINYDKLYVNSNGQIRFGTAYSSYGSSLSVTSSGTTNSIVLLGGYDLNSYAYYKFVDNGVEIMWKYAHRSVSGSSYVNYMKAIVRYDGTGTMYFIGEPNATQTSGYTFVRVLGTDYDAIIPSGQGTKSKYTNKAYEWYVNDDNFTTITVGKGSSGNSGSANKTYTMNEIPYPSSGVSTSTSGFTTITANSDSYNYTINLPSGKYVNFAGTNYNKIYAITDGTLTFTSSGNTNHGPTLSNTRNLSINPIGGQDIRMYVYYKFVNDGIEFLYKYSYWSGHTPNAWIKVKINYNGTGQIYYINGLGSGLSVGNMQSFVKVSSTDYDYAFTSGTATSSTFTQKAFEWTDRGSFTDIPTITNITSEKTILEGGKNATFIITADKPLTSIDLYVGTNLVSFSDLTTIAENTYSITAAIPNNVTTSTIPIKVRGAYKGISSYWKTISVPYTQSSVPVINSLSNITSTIKQETITDFTINYTQSTLNNAIETLTINYVKENGEILELIPEDWSVLDSSTISVNNISFQNISITNGTLKLQIKDEADTYSDIYLFPLNIVANDSPVITSVIAPTNLTGRDGIPYRRNMEFTINYTDTENDEIKYVYYRTKLTSNSSWSGWSSITIPNDSVNVLTNALKVSITTPTNSDQQRDYQFKIKDTLHESEISETTTVNILENTPPNITDLVTISETAVGSKIELTAPYTDIDLEEDAITDFYVYIDNELTTLYQTAYTDGYNIRVRNLLVDKVGEYNISLVVKDKYGKTSNKVDVPIKVTASTAPILYSYKIDDVLLNKNILLKDIYYQLSETATSITAIEYTLNNSAPIAITFEEPITSNNFSYSLENTAFTEPSTNINYINIRIKDNTGTWSPAIMGTFTIGYTENQSTISTIGVYYEDTCYSYMMCNGFITSSELTGSYIEGYGFSQIKSLVPTINGIEHPEILNYSNAGDSSGYFDFNLDFSKLETPLTINEKYEIGYILKDENNTIYTSNLGTYTYIDNSNISETLINSTNSIATTTNTSINIYSYWLTNYIEEIYNYGNYYVTPIITIDGFNSSDYSYYLNNLYPEIDTMFYIYTNFTPKAEMDTTLKLKYEIKDYDTDSLIATTNEISIPIKVTESVNNLYDLSITSVGYFRNKTKTETLPNVAAGDIQFSLNYRNSKGSAGIDAIELYIDEETEPTEILNQGYTESTSTNYKSGTITGEINYEVLGEHTFNFIVTNKEGDTYTFTKTYTIIPDASITINATKTDGSAVDISNIIELSDTDTTLVFNLESSSPNVEYSNMKLEINNVLYDFTAGTTTVDFSNLNQGYYRVKLLADTNIGKKISSNEILVVDNGVNSIITDIQDYTANITFPNSIYLFGQSYQTLYFSSWGGISTNDFCYDCYFTTDTLVEVDNFLQPVNLMDDYNGPYGSKINRLLYKVFTDNVTIYIDAVDNQGNRVYYSVSFYNRDNVKFNYYITSGTLAQINATGVRVDSNNYLYTNSLGQKINNNTSILIDTFEMETVD